MQWQPIETAPKDGSLILVFEPTCHADEQIWMTEWRANTAATSWGGSEGGAWTIYMDGQRIEPTHWMPLPAPPTENAK